MASRKSQNRKKPRKTAYLEVVEQRYYIFCEGEQTEPLYFKGFEKAISSNPIYKDKVKIEVEGIGAETLRVINYAQEYVKRNQIKDAQIWCVYDKDSFPQQDFNAVQDRANFLNQNQENVQYFLAWSNQCIEYWFILHFSWYVADNDRKYYIDFLNNQFHSLGLPKYKKKDPGLFDTLTNQGNPKKAIQRAEKRIKECTGTASQQVPATQVYLLIKELAKYLPDTIKKRYI